MLVRNLQEVVTIILIAICAGITIAKRKKLSGTDRLFIYLFAITLVVECIAFPLAYIKHNNSIVYNSFTLIELFILSSYFNRTVAFLRKYNIGWWLFFVGVIIAVLDNLFWESPFRTNSIMLMYEEFSFCMLAICSFYDLFKKDAPWLRETRFYISATVLIYAAPMLLFWALYPFFMQSISKYTIWGLFLPNVFYYISYMLIFSRYKRLRPS